MAAIVGSGCGRISANRQANPLQFAATGLGAPPYSGSVDKSLFTSPWHIARGPRWLQCLSLLLALALWSTLRPAHAAEEPDAPLPAWLVQQVRDLTQQAGARAAGRTSARVEVEVGALDARLKLAPCARVEPYLPTGSRPWGRTRVGLRCMEGPVRWNVYLPVTVKVWAPGLVFSAALPVGAVVSPADLRVAEVDHAAGTSAALQQPAQAVGRALARGVAAGEALRQADLRSRQFFAAGDTVQLLAIGAGYQVQAEGQALGPGLEGQSVRVRTDGGRVVTGVAAGERRVELAL